MPRPWLLLFFSLIPATAQESTVHKAIADFEAYLNMAGSKTAKDFHPLTSRERTHLYLKSLTNPWGLFKAAASAGLDQRQNKPGEWGQGWGPYGQRVANIEGQYAVTKTATYLISMTLHEDNRYFGSGKQGLFPRLGYALASSVLARHDDGKLHVSVSLPGGVGAGAFVSRLWLPRSQNGAAQAATSFGISMAGNCAISVVKEFLPDIFRSLQRKKDPRNQAPPPIRRKLPSRN